MKFSQRQGYSSVRTSLQVESIDYLLQNRLWNVIKVEFLDKLQSYAYPQESQKGQFFILLWKEFFGRMIDDIPTYQSGRVDNEATENYLKQWYRDARWFEIYDLIEFISPIASSTNVLFISHCNDALKKEASGYRILLL